MTLFIDFFIIIYFYWNCKNAVWCVLFSVLAYVWHKSVLSDFITSRWLNPPCLHWNFTIMKSLNLWNTGCLFWTRVCVASVILKWFTKCTSVLLMFTDSVYPPSDTSRRCLCIQCGNRYLQVRDCPSVGLRDWCDQHTADGTHLMFHVWVFSFLFLYIQVFLVCIFFGTHFEQNIERNILSWE